MDISQFESEIVQNLSRLDYVDSLELIKTDEFTVKGKAIVKKEYILSIRFRVFKTILTFSFTLLFENNRIWGLDKDNKIGYHIHPLNDVSVHESIEDKTINEIVEIFDSICRGL